MKDLTIAKKLVDVHNKCRDKGLPFDLSFQDVKKLMMARRCAYTGQPFQADDPRTFDRIIPEKGYTAGNVVACCRSINAKKGDLQPEEVKQLFQLLKRKKLV